MNSLLKSCVRAAMSFFQNRKNKSSAGKQNEKNNSPGKFNLESARKHVGTQVPEVIFKITARLDQNLDTESLYRKPGNKEMILKLRGKPEEINIDKQDVHDLASLLKMLLAEMNEPLLPKQIFETFKRTEDRSQIKKGLEELDQVRRETLDHLMQHILRVTEHEGANKMNKENICIVWAPVVYYPLENRSDAEKCKEFFGILMDVYAEPRRETKRVEQSGQKENQVDQSQKKEQLVQQNKGQKKRSKGKAPQPQSTAIGKEKSPAEQKTKENATEENGGYDFEGKREEEKGLTGATGELNVKRNEDLTIEKKREGEKGKDYTDDHKTLENEEEKERGLAREEKGSNPAGQTKELVPEIGPETKEKSNPPETFQCYVNIK